MPLNLAIKNYRKPYVALIDGIAMGGGVGAAEETGAGAQAMIDDGLMSRFPKPDAVLGQHVMVGPAGAIGGRTGVITSAADSLQIRLFGRGADGRCRKRPSILW